jgi:hypothetical protein
MSHLREPARGASGKELLRKSTGSAQVVLGVGYGNFSPPMRMRVNVICLSLVCIIRVPMNRDSR